MRFIDKDEVELLLPKDWEDKVRDAWSYVNTKIQEAKNKAIEEGKPNNEIEVIVNAVRKKAIGEKAELWSYAGSKIKAVMHDKCWYCETFENRSDMPVDHFRPKNKVAECPGHQGYWWLAFNWENYRYACTFCNSRRIDVENKTEGGKQDHFPIMQPPTWAETDKDDWHSERPILLDPTNLEDTYLLTFHENGYPREVCQDMDDETYQRAERSIYFYHLDHIKAVRARKTIAVKIRNNYARIQALLTKDQSDTDIRSEIRELKKEIIKLIREKSPFCTAARIYLQSFKQTDWVAEILERNL